MKGALATRIVVLLLASVAVAGTLIFAWPTSKPTTEPTSSTQASAPPALAPKPPPAPDTTAVETLKSLADEIGPQKSRTGRGPSFDVARIEPNGEAVIAGRAAPGATVELLRGGVAHARTTAGPSGEFVLVPEPLPSGSYDLTLRATDRDGKQLTSKDSVAVELQSGGKDKPVVALAAPGKPAVVLSKPTDGGAPAGLAIDAVEGEAGGKMYVSGSTAPGATANLYLNDAYIASATASAEGRIAFSIQSGIRPGDYRVRLDQVDTAGHVKKRAEVPFTAPAMLASPASPKAQPPGPAADASGASADAKKTAPQGLNPAAPPLPATAGGTKPAQPEPAQRVAAAAPAANPKPATPQTTQAPHDNASAPAEQPKRPSPAPSGATASQQPAPGGGAAQPASASSKPVPSQSVPSQETHVVIIPRVETAVVIRGDSLWRISQSTYGEGVRYSVIYKANRDQIRNPDLIYPGQIFVLPKQRPVN